MAKSTNLREFIESISYPRRETYNRDEVDYEIETRLILKIVDALPTGNDIREDKIYLLVDTYTLDNNDDSISYYDLWVRLNGEWVQIDKLDFTIENYFTKDEIIGLLNEKADVNHGHDTSEIDNTEIYLNINPTLIDNQKDLNNAIDIAIGSKAPINHRSTATTYGVSDENYYGHSKASSTTPLMDGTASIGSETSSFARGNHRHPTDTSRASADHIHGNISNDGKISSSINANIKNIVITDTNNNVNTTHELNGVNIADSSITESKLADNSVTSAKIVDGTIVNGDLANATIETGKIKDGAVTSDKILNGTIVNDDIANTTITGGKLSNSTITATQLANNSVTTTKIKDGNVSLVKLNSDVYDTTDGGTVNSNKLITSGAVYNGLSTKANSDDVYLKTETLNTDEITQAILDGVSNVELFELKTTLPTTNIKGNKFYLIPNNENINSNVYDIYIYVNNNWEQIDSLEFDITDYSTTNEISGMLESYVPVLQATANMNIVTGSDKKVTLEAKNNHSHGNITSGGKIGSTANKPIITTTSGTLTTGNFGSSTSTSATEFVACNDTRLSDSRTPTSHTHGNITNDGKIGSASGKIITTGDNGVLQASDTITKSSISDFPTISTTVANNNNLVTNSAIKTYVDNEIGSVISGDIDLSATHNHDDRYYTETETDNLLATKLDKSISITASSSNVKDLNNYISMGFYYCNSDANSQYIIHTPLSDGTSVPYTNNVAFFLLVETFGSGTNYIKQTLTYWSTNKTYIRTKKGGSWSSWSELSIVGHTHSEYATTTALNNKANTTHTHHDTDLDWNGVNKVNSVSPLDMAMYGEFNANRLAFIDPNNITVEYSTDGGSTWIEFSGANYQSEKIKLVTGSEQTTFFTSGNNSTTSYSDNKLRVTIKVGEVSQASELYCQSRKILLYFNTGGGADTTVKFETSTYATPTTWTTEGTYNIGGQSGWNSIPFSKVLGGYASQTGSTSTRVQNLRFTFNQSTKNCSIQKIRLFGEIAWTTPSILADSNHNYTFDHNQRTYFPSTIHADNKINSIYLNESLELCYDVKSYYRSYTNGESFGDLKCPRTNQVLPDLSLTSDGLSVLSASGEKSFIFPVVNPTEIELTSMGNIFQGFQVYDTKGNSLLYAYSNSTSSDAFINGTKRIASTSIKHTTGSKYNLDVKNDTLSFYKDDTLIGSYSLGGILNNVEYYFGIYTNANRNIILKDITLK